MTATLAAFVLFVSACSTATTAVNDAALGEDAMLENDGGTPMDARPSDSGARDASSRDADAADGDVDPRVEATVAHLNEIYCHPLAESFCANFTRCSCELETMLDLATCIMQQRSLCESFMREIAASIVAGATVAEDEVVAACAFEQGGLANECVIADVLKAPSCALAFARTVAVGSACGGGYGFACASGDGLCEDTEASTCNLLPGEGDACDVYCASPYVCRAGFCGPRALAGQVCDQRNECEVGLDCVMHACVRAGEASETCSESAPCRAGLTCDHNTCVDSLAPCMRASECDFGFICAGTRSSVCAPRIEEGFPCESSDGCAPGLQCNTRTHVCVRAPSVDEPCADVPECDADAYCNREGEGGTPLCVPRPGMGEACPLGLCAAGLACRPSADGTTSECGARAGIGDPCTPGGCETGLFCDGETGGVTYVCSMRKAASDECSYAEQCVEGTTCRPDEFHALRCLPLFDIGASCAGGDCADMTFCDFAMPDGACMPAFCSAF